DPAEAQLHADVAARLPARGQAIGLERLEHHERAVELGHRAGRVQGPPRGIRVDVDHELLQYAHASSLSQIFDARSACTDRLRAARSGSRMQAWPSPPERRIGSREASAGPSSK